MDTLIKIRQPAPDFTLNDLQGARHSLTDYRGRVVVLDFWSAECPWSARVDEKLAELLAEWDEDVLLLVVAANAGESPDMQKRVADERGLKIVLADTNQKVASLYGVLVIPHIFLIDRHGVLCYQGAFDDTNFRKRIPDRNYLQDALEAVMNGGQTEPAKTEPYGCALMRYAPRS